MTRQRQDYLTEIKDWLNRLEISIEGDIALRHQDSHIELETFFRDLLNLVFDWKLDNANALLGKSQDSFDLSDTVASVAVQVTVSTGSAKIRDTISSFVGRHDDVYRRLIFIYPRMSVPVSRADFSEIQGEFKFDADRDRLGFGSILKQAQGFDIDKLERLVHLLRKELRPLGAELPGQHSHSDSDLRSRHAKWVKETSSTFFVPGMNVSMAIEDAWIRLRVMRDDKSIVGTKSSLDEQFRNHLEFGQRTLSRDSNAAVASDSIPLTHPRSVLVGGPGDGKSTMLKRFAWRFSQESEIVVHVRLPIVLRYLLAGRSFEEALSLAGFDGSGLPAVDATRLLNSADYLFCDGLDECDPHRAHVAEQIIRWSVAHGACRICVATRPVGHEAALLPGFTHFALQPPDDRQIQELSRKLFEKSGVDHYLVKWAAFVRSIENESDSRHARKLAARNPLLLGFLIQLTLDDVDVGRTRTELYARIFDLAARTIPHDREAPDCNERIASEVVNALAWKQLQTPFCTNSETVRFVSDHLRRRFNLHILAADEAARSGLRFWGERRLVETLSVANDSRTFFIHLSLQEFAAARYARHLEPSDFRNWIRLARQKPSWKQVILLLSGIDSDARTRLALLDLDDPNDAVSREAILTAEGVFEREPPDLTGLPSLIQLLAKRFASDIPLISVEAVEQLARLAPHAKEQVLNVADATHPKTPWAALGGLLLRLIADDDRQTVEEFKEWFKGHQPIAIHFPRIGSRDDSQGLPEEGRDLQNQIMLRGLDRLFDSHEATSLAEFFDDFGELGHLSGYIVDRIQEKLVDIGMDETAKRLWPGNFDTSSFLAMQTAFRRWDLGRNNLLMLIAYSAGTAKDAPGQRPYLGLSTLWSALRVSESPGKWLTSLLDVEADHDDVGSEVIRGLIFALDLDGSAVAAEAQAALNCYANQPSNTSELIEPVEAHPDWSKVKPDECDPELIAEGILHPVPYINMAAANAVASGFGRTEAANLIAKALHSNNEHAIWHAAALAQSCLGDNAFSLLLSRLDQPISADHICVFRWIARLCGEKHRESAVKCFFSWLDVDNPELATGIAECLSEFDPPLGDESAHGLRRMLDHWTERGTKCAQHDVIVKGGSCPECSVVPPSPRSAILKELTRLGAVSFVELVQLCGDPRHDVSDVAKNVVVERAAADTQAFEDVLDQIEAGRLSPRILEKLLKLPIKKESGLARKAERLLHAPDLRVRLAVIGQLTGEWIERKAAIAYLRESLTDPEPAIRTLATRILRLI